MKVIDKTITDSETSVTIDLFEDISLPKKVKDQVAQDIGQFLIEQTLLDVNDQKSPVEGYGSFQNLTSSEYKSLKKKEVGNGKADLQLSGEMLNELDFKVSSDGLKIGVFGQRAPAADGHNDLSGKSNLPLRRFLPDTGENYKSSIQKEVDRIIADALANQGIDKNDLKDISSKTSLYETLSSLLGLESRSEIKLAVFRNQDLLDLLKEEDLLDLL